MRKKKGYYSISVVAKMFSVHQQTIRMYEKQGLITPKRSDGNTRLFSEEDVDRLEEVIHLTHKVGVNLAGVEIILKLQKKMKRMQDEMNKLFSDTEEELVRETLDLKDSAKRQAERIVAINKQAGVDISGLLSEDTPPQKRQALPKVRDEDSSEDETPDTDFQIEYDDKD